MEAKLANIQQRTSDPVFPAGLLPDLVRAANSRMGNLAMGAYAPIDPDDIPAAPPPAAAAAEGGDAYLLGRGLHSSTYNSTRAVSNTKKETPNAP